MARGAAAFIADLKQRGLLEETLILWTTEFGRMPSSQGGKGRDHNPYVFTNWLCGGGSGRREPRRRDVSRSTSRMTRRSLSPSQSRRP